jgi:transketolase
MNTADEASTVQLAINTLRFLAVDQVEQAKSGPPGATASYFPTGMLLRLLRR